MLQHLTHAQIARALRLVVTVYLEVEAGLRPARALAPYATVELINRLHAGQATAQGSGYTAQRFDQVHHAFRFDRAGAYSGLDAVVVLHRRDGTARVLALALEPVGGRWRLTRAGLPEDQARE